MATSYHIIIDEQQRALLAAVLGEACAASCLPEGTHEEEAALLLLNLQELPREEALLPNTVHGLCL